MVAWSRGTVWIAAATAAAAGLAAVLGEGLARAVPVRPLRYAIAETGGLPPAQPATMQHEGA